MMKISQIIGPVVDIAASSVTVNRLAAADFRGRCEIGHKNTRLLPGFRSSKCASAWRAWPRYRQTHPRDREHGPRLHTRSERNDI
jgi:hypothetical protein